MGEGEVVTKKVAKGPNVGIKGEELVLLAAWTLKSPGKTTKTSEKRGRKGGESK